MRDGDGDGFAHCEPYRRSPDWGVWQVTRAHERHLIVCASVDAYMRTLAALCKESSVTTGAPAMLPVLGEDGIAGLARDLEATVLRASELQALDLGGDATAQIARSLDAPSASASVVVSVDDRYAPFATALALLSGRRLVKTSAAALDGTLQSLQRGPLAGGDDVDRNAASVTIVGHPDVFDAELVARLTGLDGKPLVRCAFGVLTARSEEAVSRMVAQSLVLSQLTPAPFFSVLPTPVTEPTRDGHDLVEWGKFDPTAAERLSTELFDLVALTSHGDPIDLHLSGVVLCGRTFEAGTARSGPEHTCMGKDHCPRARGGQIPRLRVDRVRSRVLFAETCSGVALRDRVFPGALSLGLSALDGTACAYLSTTKVIRGSGLGAVLTSAMLSSGETLGETTRVLDIVHRQITADAPSFLLVGDADARFTPRHDARSLTLVLPDDGVVRVAPAGSFRGSLLRVALRGPRADALAALPEGAELRVVARRLAPAPLANTEICAVVVPNALGAPLTVLVAASRPFSVDEIEIEVLDETAVRRALSETFARVGRRLYQLDAIRAQVAAYPEARATAATRKCAEDLSMVTTRGSALLERALSAFYGAQSRVARLPFGSLYEWVANSFAADVASLDVFIADSLPSWELHQYQVPLYGGVLFSSGTEAPHGPCYRCKLPAFDLTFHAHARPDLRRVLTHCPGCDLLFDRVDDEIGVEILGESPVARGTTTRRELVITNEHDTARTFAATVWFEGKHEWLDATITPRSQAFELPARTVVRVPFDIAIGKDTAPGVYRFTAFTTSELSWSLSGEPFTVTR